eukprot:1326644-Amorphochlora_amoeboformis.AAC.1
MPLHVLSQAHSRENPISTLPGSTSQKSIIKAPPKAWAARLLDSLGTAIESSQSSHWMRMRGDGGLFWVRTMFSFDLCVRGISGVLQWALESCLRQRCHSSDKTSWRLLLVLY